MIIPNPRGGIVLLGALALLFTPVAISSPTVTRGVKTRNDQHILAPTQPLHTTADQQSAQRFAHAKKPPVVPPPQPDSVTGSGSLLSSTVAAVGSGVAPSPHPAGRAPPATGTSQIAAKSADTSNHATLSTTSASSSASSSSSSTTSASSSSSSASSSSSSSASPKNKSLALALVVFFGWTGAADFYITGGLFALPGLLKLCSVLNGLLCTFIVGFVAGYAVTPESIEAAITPPFAGHLCEESSVESGIAVVLGEGAAAGASKPKASSGRSRECDVSGGVGLASFIFVSYFSTWLWVMLAWGIVDITRISMDSYTPAGGWA